ncbi:MAG: ABC-2 transporter permease [Acetobacterium woodii]|nr:ABC-2 transporter permease [Acetobacterium woodii]
MDNLLYKEFKLAMHPTSLIFLSLSAMMLIPNYPYYVTFFYTSLGIFFMCLSGRENNDIFYTMMLPVRKKDIVKSRFLFVVVIQLAQVLTAIPFAYIRSLYDLPGNQVGIDANTAFFGLSFLMMGLFNLVFFTKYYKNTDKVGIAFGWGSLVMTVFMIIAEASVHIVPFMKNYLDTKDPNFIEYKLMVLVVGILVYSVLTLVAYKNSVRSFEALDF